MMLILLLAFVAAAVVVIGYAVGIYNQLIGVRVNVDRSWSNIEVRWNSSPSQRCRPPPWQ